LSTVFAYFFKVFAIFFIFLKIGVSAFNAKELAKASFYTCGMGESVL
jgi:hypothetical protein